MERGSKWCSEKGQVILIKTTTWERSHVVVSYNHKRYLSPAQEASILPIVAYGTVWQASMPARVWRRRFQRMMSTAMASFVVQ
jgi:hypothetical protein